YACTDWIGPICKQGPRAQEGRSTRRWPYSRGCACSSRGLSCIASVRHCFRERAKLGNSFRPPVTWSRRGDATRSQAVVSSRQGSRALLWPVSCKHGLCSPTPVPAEVREPGDRCRRDDIPARDGVGVPRRPRREVARQLVRKLEDIISMAEYSRRNQQQQQQQQQQEQQPQQQQQ
ncbi:unnamed protein product, partial [Laminaria digitata]